MSLVAGVMAGIAILDLLPEALEMSETQFVTRWLLGGFLAIFLLERFLPSHCHDVAEDEHTHACSHEHKLTWIGTYGGLTLHSILAGVALAASWQLGGFSVAMGVFLAILLHKPFDGLTLIAMMRIANMTTARAQLMNVIFSLGVPVGVVLFQLGGEVAPSTIAAALAFSAGMFLCISLSDLLPELQFHGHDRIYLTVALLLGLAIAWGISSMHSHEEYSASTFESIILCQHLL